MTVHIDFLSDRLDELFFCFEKRLVSKSPTLKCTHGKSSNDAFLLRSFLAIRWNDCEDELSVTVDVRDLRDFVCIESDVCFDDGRIVSVGPSVEITSTVATGQVGEIEAWLAQFENFLCESEQIILDSIG